MSNIEFRRIQDEEFNQAYRVVCEATEWLLSRNIRQWIDPFPHHIYLEWQRKGENYALFHNDAMAVVLSLIRETLQEWDDKSSNEQLWWLTTMATSKDYRGKGLGRTAVQKAKDYLRENGAKELYIDCVYGNGFLPGYYESLRFKLLDRKLIEYPEEGVFDMVLMKCALVDSTPK